MDTQQDVLVYLEDAYSFLMDPAIGVAIKEIKQLRETLRFYADENHYQPKKVWTTSLPQYEPDGYKLVTPVLADKGTRAKTAIAKATGEE